MNPICQTDISNPECQLWMNRVCEHCRELYAKEASDPWAAWWHDDTPPIYKEVADMTVYDCNKLKNVLEMEVAALNSKKTQTISMQTSEYFISSQAVLYFAVYIMITMILVLMWYTYQHARRHSPAPEDKVKEMVEELPSTVEAALSKPLLDV